MDLVLRVDVETSSDDYHVDQTMRAGSPSLSYLFLGWCNGVMDSAHDFDLLGESVPQVRVSACTLALLGFFQLVIYFNLFIFSTCHLF